jgi:glycosyltransferase involved in cell wall biosynthesis
MDRSVEVSVVIPTYNRRVLVARAVRSVLAQTCQVEEIIVIDDGSTDGTVDALAAEFGDRIRVQWQANAGVSAARNRGLQMARGHYLALLDSDDEWLPEKIALQLPWLQARPDFGMVLCDVQLMHQGRPGYNILRRRDSVPHDGNVLKWVLMQPSMTPSSVLIRREVFDQTGGFNESLRTAEDLDFHCRVAAAFKIGVIEQPLVRATILLGGLSSLGQTYDDYLRVIEGHVAASAGQVDVLDQRRALARAYGRNARGMVLIGRRRAGLSLAMKAWSHEPEWGLRWRPLAELVLLSLRVAWVALRRPKPDHP